MPFDPIASTRRGVLPFGIAAAGFLASCTSRSILFDAATEADVSHCVPGASNACSCTDGRMGARICTPARTLDVCRCETPATACVAGMSVTCACSDGTAGTQRCLESGAAFGDCYCSSGIDGGPDDASSDAEIVDAIERDAMDRDASESCVRVRCDAAATACGRYSDGCGGIIDCGPCASPVLENLHLAANSILADRTRNVVYATVPSSVTVYGNRVAIIDALSARVTGAIPAGSDPTTMAMSDDAHQLYVSIPSTSAIRRIDLDARASIGEIVLAPDSGGHPVFAGEMVVMPGRPDRLVTFLTPNGGNWFDRSVSVIDHGVILASHTEAPALLVGGSASTVYGFNNQTTDYGFYEIVVDDMGAHFGRGTRAFGFDGFDTVIVSQDGYVYSSRGHLIEEPTFTLLGMYPTTGYPVPDRVRHRVYFVRSPQTSTGEPAALEIFDREMFTMLARVDLPDIGAGEVVAQAVRYAPNGIAIRTTIPSVPASGSVYLLQTDSVLPDAP